MKIMVGAIMALALVGASSALAQPPQGGPGGPGMPGGPEGGPPGGPGGGGPGGPGGGPGGGARGPRQPEVIAPSIPIDLAVMAAKTAVSSCSGFKVGVAILDQSGQPKLYYVGDGAGAAHATRAAQKANSALLLNGSSGDLNARVASDPAIAEKVNANKNSYMGMAGGLPIIANGQPMGAIGVSGAEPSAKDEECAAAGLKAIQGQLK